MIFTLALELLIPQLLNIFSCFLFVQLHLNDLCNPLQVPVTACPQHNGRINIFNSACSSFFAPSDLSGIGGMYCEHIHACPTWSKGASTLRLHLHQHESRPWGNEGYGCCSSTDLFLFHTQGQNVSMCSCVMVWYPQRFTWQRHRDVDHAACSPYQ